MFARHVSDLIGPSSGAFYKLYLQIWYVVIRVLLDTSITYVCSTCFRPHRSIFRSVLQAVFADLVCGSTVRSETCGANICDE